jgi:hypothetical protein
MQRWTVEWGSAGQLAGFGVVRRDNAAGLDGQQYMVAQNGQRFLINILPPDTTTPITVIQNWRPKE